jgi:hypothetical protein
MASGKPCTKCNGKGTLPPGWTGPPVHYVDTIHDCEHCNGIGIEPGSQSEIIREKSQNNVPPVTIINNINQNQSNKVIQSKRSNKSAQPTLQAQPAQVTCPHCNHPFDIKYLGAKCPHCGKKVKLK